MGRIPPLFRLWSGEGAALNQPGPAYLELHWAGPSRLSPHAHSHTRHLLYPHLIPAHPQLPLQPPHDDILA